ncbi:MAG: DUF1836 domain-containing protein [Lachnospiraceae bacterium]|nr:DUF1836 domain-containing protein [Lachnospiraceae bacterium]MDD7024054.1 DUF1836 domain-containing protein [Oscillospiraceae bacterium]MDY5648417.1 DUF1836 domain-containing protein [Lachnospiraceae bacterium]
MMLNTEDLITEILNSFARLDYIKPEEIPNIDLYMDQVTTFMDSRLASSRRYDSDKILTKTMINNYAKNKLLPPPVKKKYSRNHMLMLIFIYYFKNLLSINDIQKILSPISEKYFQTEGELNLEALYEEVFSLEKSEIKGLKEDVLAKFQESRNTFREAPEEDQDFLQLFAFICMLSYDIYVRKQIIEKLIDNALEDNPR